MHKYELRVDGRRAATWPSPADCKLTAHQMEASLRWEGLRAVGRSGAVYTIVEVPA